MEGLNCVYFSLGSNLGDRLHHLKSALAFITQEIGPIKKASSIYETPPFGFESNDAFYNQCVVVETEHTPHDVLSITQRIETLLGRTAKSSAGNYTSRTIDIDLLYFGNELINDERLTIPHSQLRFRKFVLIPLNEIAPDHIDPTTYLTVRQLLQNCTDRSEIVKIH